MPMSPSARRLARWGALALAPLLLAPVVGPASGAVGDRNGNGWAQLTENDTVGPEVRPGLAHLPDGTLLVAWREGNGSTYSLTTNTVGPGNAVGTPTPALTWSGLNPDPEVLARPGGADIVFIGSDGTGDFAGPSAYRMPVESTGTSGEPAVERYFPAGAVQDDYAPFDAARRADGGIVVNQSRWWHSGPAAEGELDNNEFTDYPNATTLAQSSLATVGNDTYLGYFAYGNGDVDRGLYVARLLPASSPRVRLPGSWHTDAPVALTGSTTGVLWAAYCTGTDACDQLVLRDVVGERSLIVPTGEYAAEVVLSPGPSGRMWVVWQSGVSAVSAVRTNKAGTRFGPVRRSSPFHVTDGIDAVAADGSTGAADVVVSGKRELWHRRFLPVLSATATPVRWRVNRRQRVTFTVRDAGDPLGGATATVGARSCTTGSTGVCSLVVPARSKPATLTATVSKTGYLSASVTLRVVR